MERLTHKRANGIKQGYWGLATREQLIERLAAYEDTGLEPEEVAKANTFVGSQAEKMMIELQAERKRDRWIPVTERLPEAKQLVLVTVHASEWISDYGEAFVPEVEKIRYPEQRYVSVGYIDEYERWTFSDLETGFFTEADLRFGKDLSRLYAVIVAWMPLPEPYAGNVTVENEEEKKQ